MGLRPFPQEDVVKPCDLCGGDFVALPAGGVPTMEKHWCEECTGLPRNHVRVRRLPCSGMGKKPTEIMMGTLIGRSGHEYPGRAICPDCGRQVSYRLNAGINRHLRPEEER